VPSHLPVDNLDTIHLEVRNKLWVAWKIILASNQINYKSKKALADDDSHSHIIKGCSADKNNM